MIKNFTFNIPDSASGRVRICNNNVIIRAVKRTTSGVAHSNAMHTKIIIIKIPTIIC